MDTEKITFRAEKMSFQLKSYLFSVHTYNSLVLDTGGRGGGDEGKTLFHPFPHAWRSCRQEIENLQQLRHKSFLRIGKHYWLGHRKVIIF
jgi:hypothetical protein